MSVGGSYVLVLANREPVSVTVGALGDRELPPGWLAYVGSATGPGGFSRLDRHRRVASGENQTRHWHIDYILGTDAVSVVDDYRFPGWDGECLLADRFVGTPIEGCGSSDCNCESHVFSVSEYQCLQASVESVSPGSVGSD